MLIDEIHRVLREREDAQEQDGHHGSQNQPAPYRMRDHGINLVGVSRSLFSGVSNNFRGDSTDGFVARTHKRSRPVSPLVFPAFLPRLENLGRSSAQWS